MRAASRPDGATAPLRPRALRRGGSWRAREPRDPPCAARPSCAGSRRRHRREAGRREASPRVACQARAVRRSVENARRVLERTALVVQDVGDGQPAACQKGSPKRLARARSVTRVSSISASVRKSRARHGSSPSRERDVAAGAGGARPARARERHVDELFGLRMSAPPPGPST